MSIHCRKIPIKQALGQFIFQVSCQLVVDNESAYLFFGKDSFRHQQRLEYVQHQGIPNVFLVNALASAHVSIAVPTRGCQGYNTRSKGNVTYDNNAFC